jgi:hypothetical protein
MTGVVCSGVRVMSYMSYMSDTVPDKETVEEFFHDEPDLLWKPLREHYLEESPCYPIIGVRIGGNNYGVKWYYCKIHTDRENIHLESIEHHCKYKESDRHKAEILRLLKGEGENS